MSELYSLPTGPKGGEPRDGLSHRSGKAKARFRLNPKLLAFEIIAFLGFAILFAFGFLAWRLQQGPIDLSALRGQIERSMSEARGGNPVKFDTVALEWVRERNKVEAVVKNFAALDAKGATVFGSERASISISAAALMGGKLRTTGIRLDNGTAKVIRSKDGVWSLADMVIAREPPSDKPFDILRDLNWTTLAEPIRALISAGSFERVEINNFKLTVDDQKAGTTWSASPVAGVWSATAEGVALDLNVKLSGAGDEPNNLVFSLASDGAVSKATGRLTLEGVNPMAVAKVFGYTGEAFTPATPGNAAFTIEATEKGGLQSTRISLSDITGSAKFWGRDIKVSKLAMDAIYDPATKGVKLEALDVVSDLATGRFTGTADFSSVMAGDLAKPVPVHLVGYDFQLGLQPTFETSWPIESADITGTVSTDLQHVNVSSVKAVSGEMAATGSGEVWMDGPADARRIGVKVDAVADGVITPQQVVMFWPQHLGVGSRTWVRDRIPAGKASRAVFHMDMQPGTLSAGFMPDEALQLDFEVRDATVKFLDDFPAVTGVAGKGRLRGNSITIDASAGTMAGWGVDEAHVVIPQFVGGKPMDITVMGQGQLGPLMRVLDQSNLHVGTRYNLAVDQMAGLGGLDLRLQLPTHTPATEKNIRYSIKGGFRNSSAPNLAGGFGLSESDVLFELSQDRMSISGAGKFGPAPVVFAWNERFADELKGTELTANAKVTPDLLNAFGIAARGYMQGEAAVDLRAVGPGGRDFSSIRADVDFTPAQLEIPEFGWKKKYDAAAKGSFVYSKNSAGATEMEGQVKADGLEFAGQARMDAAGAFQSANIQRIYSRDGVDLRGSIAQRNDGGYRIALNGPFFDASPWMDQVLSMSGDKPETDIHGEPLSTSAEASPIFEINLDAAKMRLRDNAEMSDAKIALVVDGEGPRNGTVIGTIADGKKLNVALTTVDEKLKVAIRADDAGFGSRVLLKGDWLLGGKLNIDGTFGKQGGDVMVTMNDVRLKDAPAVANLFSVASLQGLADVLNGDGILFSSVQAPLKMHDKRVDIVGLSAQGPSLGFTARGWFVPSTSDISLDGVLAPSLLGVNSVLGGIPILGDLFVSRQGEGIFAPIYWVRGSLYKMRVGINPVTILTPGVVRRMFENPAEPPPETEAAPNAGAPMAQRGGTRKQ